ncbi:phosphatase PAP2 family protein [Adhaeribacter aquaticus]|uniref:phosphatase PAP2 family protein n=1 Tax=Adhaeribacter aquaticus TaxID=299567 RepID=UPI0004226B85|nr:phosphatase PAP2 family protein [Adhaeribacter aquaticus]
MLQYLLNLDKDLFLQINGQHHPFWDVVMVWVSNKFFWIPFYIGLAAFLVYLFRKKSAGLVAIIGLAIASADLFSSAFLKPYVGRLRPCKDATLEGLINVVDVCGGKYGFVSSHAANSFALAMILALVLHPKYTWLKILLLIWAVVVSYSRVYLGVHYPGDILGGALLGSMVGYLWASLFKKLIIRKNTPAL